MNNSYRGARPGKASVCVRLRVSLFENCLTIKPFYSIVGFMFVSVILDPGGEDSAKELTSLMVSYGFKRVQRACWESTRISPAVLSTLKQDIDRATDSYDTVRLYQFPVEGALAVTELCKKKWRRILVKPPVKAARTATPRK